MKLSKRETHKKILKAKEIALQIMELYHYRNDTTKPKGYGNDDLDKATDALYKYIEFLENEYLKREASRVND